MASMKAFYLALMMVHLLDESSERTTASSTGCCLATHLVASLVLWSVT